MAVRQGSVPLAAAPPAHPLIGRSGASRRLLSCFALLAGPSGSPPPVQRSPRAAEAQVATPTAACEARRSRPPRQTSRSELGSGRAGGGAHPPTAAGSPFFAGAQPAAQLPPADGSRPTTAGSPAAGPGCGTLPPATSSSGLPSPAPGGQQGWSVKRRRRRWLGAFHQATAGGCPAADTCQHPGARPGGVVPSAQAACGHGSAAAQVRPQRRWVGRAGEEVGLERQLGVPAIWVAELPCTACTCHAAAVGLVLH